MEAGKGAGEAFGRDGCRRVRGLNGRRVMFFRSWAIRGRYREGLAFHTDVGVGWCSRWGVSGRAGGRCACGVAGVRARQWAEVLGVVAAAVGAGDAGGVVRRGLDDGAVCDAYFQGGLGLLE